MATVFITYSRKDIEFAKRLTAGLQENGMDYWIDWEGIPPTVDWWNEIQKGIVQADIYIFLISPDGVNSEVNLKELDYATHLNKRIIPIVARDISSEAAPKALQHLNWIYLREGDDFDDGVKKVITAIRTNYEWVQAHRQLQVRALEWDRKGKDRSYLLRGKALQEAEMQLELNATEEPFPTDLQREFIRASRQNLSILNRGVEAVSSVFSGARSEQPEEIRPPATKTAGGAKSARQYEVALQVGSGAGTTFISYARLNRDFAVKLATDLRSDGFPVWLDQLDIHTGARWDVEVEKALKESQIFMVILSPASISSENVLDEIGYAIDSGKIILPILLENEEIPLRLRRFQYVSFIDRSYEEGLQSIKELLKKLAKISPTLEEQISQDSSPQTVPEYAQMEPDPDSEETETQLETHLETEAERLQRLRAEITANILERNRAQAVVNDQARGEDQLGIKEEVEALAETLLLRDVEPPVAVGVMGGWGSGKSFVMYLIGRYVEQTRAKEVKKGWPDGKEDEDLDIPAYTGHIYQIQFNAWTYAKSNLWASLMDTIFTCLNRQMQLERLFAYQGFEKAEQLPATEDVRAGLLAGGDVFKKIYSEDYQISLDPDLSPQIKDRLTFWSERLLSQNLLWQVLRNQNEDALKTMHKEEQELEQYKARRSALEQAQQAETVAPSQLDDKTAKGAYYALLQTTLLGFVTDSFGKTIREDLKNTSIQPESLVDLEKKTRKLLEGPKGFLDALRRNRFYWLAAVSLAGIAIVFPYLWNRFALTPINHVVSYLVAFASTIAPFIPTLRDRWQKIVQFEAETRKAFESAHEAQRTRKAEEIASSNLPLDEKVRQLEEEIKVGSLPACEVLIRIKENQIEQQRLKIGPAAKYSDLLEFVQSRLNAAVYENQLGLMHQVRQDIDELTYSLVSSANKEIFPRGKPRVILYIDDLDRCPPQRVVEILEAVQLLLNTKLFIVILGLDTRYVTRALEKEYKEILQHEGDPSGLDYIEKIIQIPYRVRPIERNSMQKYLAMQMDIEERPEPEPIIQQTPAVQEHLAVDHSSEQGSAPLEPQMQAESIASTEQTSSLVGMDAQPDPVDTAEDLSSSGEIASPAGLTEEASFSVADEPEIPEKETTLEPEPEEIKRPEVELPPAVIKFKQEDLVDLTICCQQISLTPRSIKRVVNVFKLMKIFWFRSDKEAGLAERDRPRPIKQAAICLLALSSAYPEVMREVFVHLENLYRHSQDRTRLFAALRDLKLPPGSAHELAWQYQRYIRDVSSLNSMPGDDWNRLDQLTLEQLEFSTFNIVRSFSFVGDPVYWTDGEEDKSKSNGRYPHQRVSKLNRN